MSTFIDMTGWIMSEHGVPDSRLTVIKRVEDHIMPSGQRQIKWLCECSCEKQCKIEVLGSNLRNGNVKSCGCLFIEETIKRNKKYNIYDLSSKYGIGYTSNTNEKFYFDIDDYNKIKDYCWHAHVDHNGYHILQAWDSETKQVIRMHWLIIGKNYDHINRNTFDNRKENLRIATHKENSRNHSKQKNNTSGFTGVSLHKKSNKWVAYIIIDKHQISLGMFSDKDEAVYARLNAEMKYFGDFAPQKHLFEQYGITTQNELEVTNEL